MTNNSTCQNIIRKVPAIAQMYIKSYNYVKTQKLFHQFLNKSNNRMTTLNGGEISKFNTIRYVALKAIVAPRLLPLSIKTLTLTDYYSLNNQ